mgnify:CR=1
MINVTYTVKIALLIYSLANGLAQTHRDHRQTQFRKGVTCTQLGIHFPYTLVLESESSVVLAFKMQS